MNHMARLIGTVLMTLAFATTSDKSLADDLVLGDYLLTRETLSAPLREARPIATGLASHRFLTGVGGVAFGAEATPSDGTEIVDIRYVTRQGDSPVPDGERVRLTIRKNGEQIEIQVPLFDWEVLPIARLAASDQQACFTLFGALPDTAEAERRTARGERILGYHPALEDTLLGLRLFQTDVLGLEWSFCDLPRNGGLYLLGPGEQAPDLKLNESVITALHETLDHLHPSEAHQSYLICDYGQSVTFSVSEGSLLLTGEPYWWCWKYSMEDEDALNTALSELNAQANDAANAALRTEFDKDQRVLSSGAFDRKWTDDHQQARFDVFFDDEFDRLAFGKLVKPMPDYSATYTRQMRTLQGTNPTVYRSCVTTMRYRALFRHFRTHSPEQFEKFLVSLDGVAPAPLIQTPTIMRPHR